MNRPTKFASVLCAIVLLVLETRIANAQSKKWGQECVDPQNCPFQQMQRSEEEEKGSTKRRKQYDQTDAENQKSEETSRKRQVGEGVETNKQVVEEPPVPRKKSSHAQGEWQFDSKRHERRRKRDDRFRFEFSGFWYPEPYWWYDYGYIRPYRISCGEGRELLLDRGFRRVRTFECRGRIYTYFARRYGDAFRIQVNARTGRIVSVRPA
jgi:hypothetical protein